MTILFIIYVDHFGLRLQNALCLERTKNARFYVPKTKVTSDPIILLCVPLLSVNFIRSVIRSKERRYRKHEFRHSRHGVARKNSKEYTDTEKFRSLREVLSPFGGLRRRLNAIVCVK